MPETLKFSSRHRVATDPRAPEVLLWRARRRQRQGRPTPANPARKHTRGMRKWHLQKVRGVPSESCGYEKRRFCRDEKGRFQKGQKGCKLTFNNVAVCRGQWGRFEGVSSEIEPFEGWRLSTWTWALAAGGMLAWAALSPKKASAATVADLLKAEPPNGPLPSSTPEDAAVAARELSAYLAAGGNFGTKDFPSPEVALAQRALQVADDGIVGPITRNAARKYGVELPPRLKKSQPVIEPPPEGMSPTSTVSPQAKAAGATEPPRVVAREQKGSVVARVVLTGLPSIGGETLLKIGLKRNIGAIGRQFSTCPKAPKLVGSPSYTVQEKGGAFAVTFRWPAMWSYAGVAPELKRCIDQKMKKDPNIAQYYAGSVVTRS